jgi:hypothetical protein
MILDLEGSGIYKIGYTKLEIQNWIYKIGDTKLETQNWRHKIGDTKSVSDVPLVVGISE